MCTKTAAEVMQTLFAVLLNGDTASLEGIVHPMVTFTIYSNGEFSGTHHGLEKCVWVMKTVIEKTNSTMTGTPIKMLSNENEVMAWAHFTGRRPDGRSYDSYHSYYYRIEDGKIIESYINPSEPAAYDAFLDH